MEELKRQIKSSLEKLRRLQRAKHAINDNSHSLLCLTIKVHWGIACTEIFMTINGFGGL